MNILEMLTGPGNGAAVQQLSSQFGLRPEQATAALSALLPSLASGLQREAATSEGESSLASALAGGQHERYIDQPDILAVPDTTTDGNAILGHIFGSKDVSRQVAAGAAQTTGIDAAILKKMLPVIAAMVMGALSKQSRSGGATGSGGGLGGMLGSLLDRDRDGSVIDDLTGMLGGALGRKGTATG